MLNATRKSVLLNIECSPCVPTSVQLKSKTKIDTFNWKAVLIIFSIGIMLKHRNHYFYKNRNKNAKMRLSPVLEESNMVPRDYNSLYMIFHVTS